MLLGMFCLNKYPHIFNYTQKVTKENAERLYKTATKMIRILNVLIVYTFVYITYSIIQTALGNQNGLGALFTPIFLVLMFGIMGFFTFKSLKKRKHTNYLIFYYI